jgi:hypothetical protein
MTGKKRIGLFLVVAGLGLFALAGNRWRGDADLRARTAVKMAALDDSARSVHETLVKVSLQSKALQNSYATMPDTLRRYGAGKLMEIQGGYNKTIRKLEFEERDLKVDMATVRREAERERASARARAIPVAAAAIVALMAGTMLILIPVRRVGA